MQAISPPRSPQLYLGSLSGVEGKEAKQRKSREGNVRLGERMG